MFDIEKCIELFKHHDKVKFILTGCGERECDTKNFELMVNECEYRIAEKPIRLINEKDIKLGNITFKKGTKGYKCPKCYTHVGYRHNHCHECGKKIDWSEVE